MTDHPVRIAYLCARHPLMGGEWYRCTRPGALVMHHFGWTAAACTYMATEEDNDGGPLKFITLNQTLVEPDVIIIRPVKEWRQEWSDQAHANGQLVVADIDDDLWAHEDWVDTGRPNDDGLDDWFWKVDAVLSSTRWLSKRIRDMGHSAPVITAPNCYDPYGITPGPRPGRVIGTRLWLAGRMSGDMKMYDDFVYPLLEELDLEFLHVGAEEGHRFVDRGWDEKRLIERKAVPIPLMSDALKNLSIGTIMMADNPYNAAKTETHAVELASGGIPFVAASNHPLYRTIPGRVETTADAVKERIQALMDPVYWDKESTRAIKWARAISKKREQEYLVSILRVVNMLHSAQARY